MLLILFSHANDYKNIPYQSGTESASKTYSVKIYFSKHPDSDNHPTRTFPVYRTSPNSGVARFSLTQLIAGPTSSEKASGYFTDFKLEGQSNCSGSDFTISISSGIATVQFCRDVSSPGELADARMKAETEATLGQFSEITKVIVLNKGYHCLFDLSGMDLCKK